MLKKFGHLSFFCLLLNAACLSPLPRDVAEYAISTADSLEPQQVLNGQGYVEWRLNERGPKIEISFPFDSELVMDGLEGVTEIGGEELPNRTVVVEWCSEQHYVCVEEDENGECAAHEIEDDCHPEEIMNPDLVNDILADNIHVTATVRQQGQASFSVPATCYDTSANIFNTITCSFFDRRIVDSGTVTLHKEFSYVKNGVRGNHRESTPAIPYELTNRPIPSNAANYLLSYHPFQPNELTLSFSLHSYANRNLMERSVRNTIIEERDSNGGGGILRNRCELRSTEEDIYVSCSFRKMRDLDTLRVSFPGYFGGSYSSPEISYRQAFASPNLATINPLPQDAAAYSISYSGNDTILSFSLDRTNTDMAAGHLENSVRHIQMAEDGPDGASQAYAECRITVRWSRSVECSFSTQSRRAQSITINYSQYGFTYNSPEIRIPARPAAQDPVPPRNNRRNRQAEDQDNNEGVREREEAPAEEAQAQTTNRSPRKPFGGVSNTSYAQNENTDEEDQLVDEEASVSSSCSLAVQNGKSQSLTQQMFAFFILQMLVYTRKKLILKK